MPDLETTRSELTLIAFLTDNLDNFALAMNGPSAPARAEIAQRFQVGVPEYNGKSVQGQSSPLYTWRAN
jgi:hypothetical protein